MEIIVEHSANFSAPAERLWACLSDLGNWGPWVEGVSLRWASEQAPGPGSRLIVGAWGSESPAILVREWSAPHLMRLSTEAGQDPPARVELSLALRPGAQETTTLDLRLELRSALAPLPFWLRWLLPPPEKKLREEISALLRRVEDSLHKALS